MEIVKTLHVKLFFFGSLGPVGNVTVYTEEASNNDFIIKPSYEIFIAARMVIGICLIESS